MIVIDDLRAGLSDGDTGRNLLSTPHLDTLAARGVKFTRAYAQYALCSPSRSSALTGTRPDTTLVFDLTTHFRQHLPSVVTLPEHFKQHGYFTFGAGKIFHRGLGDDERAWSLRSQPAVDRPAYAVPLHSALDKARKQASREEISDRGKEEKTRRKSGTSRSGVGGTPLHTTPLQRGGKVRRGPVLEVGPRNATFHDHVVADEVIAALRRAAPAALLAAGWPSSTGGETNQRDKVAAQPFFIVAGFIRPHLPWVAPESFWDLYSDRTRRDGEGSSTRGGGGSSKETAKANVRPPSFPRPIPLGGAVSPLDAAPGKKVPEFALQGAQHSELSAYFGVPPHLLHRQDEQSHSAAKLQSLQQQQQQQQQQLGGATDEEGTAGSSTPATSLVPPQPVVSEASMRRGYAACTSFVDEQAGRVLSELDLLGLSLGSAAVVVWGDHGFRLGEQGQWGKNSNSELDTLVPLTVALPPDWLSRRAASLHLPPPWAQRNHVNGDGGGGVASQALVELVDLFPTLVELCGLPSPAAASAAALQQHRRHHPLEGSSFAALLWNTTLAASFRGDEGDGDDGEEQGDEISLWKRAAFSQVLRRRSLMGYSLRTPRHRFTVWVDTRKLSTQHPRHQRHPQQQSAVEVRRLLKEVEDDKDDVAAAAAQREASESNRRQGRKVVKGVELYDYGRQGGGQGERVNLADSAAYAATKRRLLALWQAGFCGASGGDSDKRASAPEPPLCVDLKRS